MSWTPERVEALKVLWSEGHSASVVAAKLGCFKHCTDGGRSAVIGKIHRLGLPNPKGKPRRHARRSTKRKLKTKTRPQFTFGNQAFRNLYLADSEPYVPPAEEVVIPLNERKTLQMLNEADCRWPIGDPQQPDFHFCAKTKIPGLPYCEVHSRRAFLPPQPRPRSPAGAPAPVQAELEVAA